MCSSVYAGAYGFSVGQSGTVLLYVPRPSIALRPLYLAHASTVHSSIAVAGLVGISIDTTLQAKLYGRARRRSPSGRAEPEARLYCATVVRGPYPSLLRVYR
jgi:hypothetical protein